MDNHQTINSTITPIHPRWKNTADFAQQTILSWVEIDLNQILHFEKFLLTLWVDQENSQQFYFSQTNENGSVQNWEIQDKYYLKLYDHAGVGHLSLFSKDGLIHTWHFTLAINSLITQFKDKFNQRFDLIKHSSTIEKSENSGVCPTCKSPMIGENNVCLVCDPETEIPPSTLTLFKLWRFAKPYKKDLILVNILIALIPMQWPHNYNVD